MIGVAVHAGYAQASGGYWQDVALLLLDSPVVGRPTVRFADGEACSWGCWAGVGGWEEQWQMPFLPLVPLVVAAAVVLLLPPQPQPLPPPPLLPSLPPFPLPFCPLRCCCVQRLLCR